MEVKPGVYYDMPEAEYRALPRLNYSLLADFNQSQDHALQVRQNQSYFEFGKAFELVIQDISKDTRLFYDRFFVSQIRGEMPKGVAEWIESEADLSNKYNLNKDGSRSKVSARLHEWLDACIDNPGKMPMSQIEYDQLCIMAWNFLDMHIYGHPLYEILPVAEFQVPIVWEINGIAKKALVDVLIETDLKTYTFDIKTSVSLSNHFTNFKKMLRSRYWIQDIHYSEGIKATCKNPMPFMFLVSSKSEPFLAQPFGLDPDSRIDAEQAYSSLCYDFAEWDKSGRPPKGWKEYEEIKLYF